MTTGMAGDVAALRALLLARFPIFAQSPAPLLGELTQAAARRVAAGGVLFEANTPCSGFPLVLDGSVRVCKAMPNGRELVLYRVSPGEGCILSGACLLGNVDYAARGVAETDVTLLGLAPNLFNRLLVEHEPFRRFVFDMFGTRLAEIMQAVEDIAFRRLDQRLAQLLIQRGPVVNATHQNLADELGTVREVVSRLLRGFEERGWVRLERERVTVIDPRALATFARP